MAQKKEQIKTPEKELSDKEIDIRCRYQYAEFICRMLTEMIEYRCKIKEEVKAMQSEIKKNTQGTNREGKETGTQINDLEQSKEKNVQPEQNKDTRIQKQNDEKLGNLWDY